MCIRTVITRKQIIQKVEKQTGKKAVLLFNELFTIRIRGRESENYFRQFSAGTSRNYS